MLYAVDCKEVNRVILIMQDLFLVKLLWGRMVKEVPREVL